MKIFYLTLEFKMSHVSDFHLKNWKRVKKFNDNKNIEVHPKICPYKENMVEKEKRLCNMTLSSFLHSAKLNSSYVLYTVLFINTSLSPIHRQKNEQDCLTCRSPLELP